MRGVIKSELAEKRVRSVLLAETEQPRIAAGPEVEPEVDPALAAAQAEIERLSEALRLREMHVERLERAIEEARIQGEAEGRKAGFAEGSRYADKAVATLDAACRAACERLEQDLHSLERLAALIAQTALEQVLGPEADQAALTAQIVRRQIGHLDAQSVLSVEVSAHDFTPLDLAQVAERASDAIEVRARDDIGSGGCRIKLKLGAIDVGPRQQWEALAVELSAIARPSAAP